MRLIKTFRYILIPFSLIYYFLASLRNIFYGLHIFKGHTLDATVISVGNITWGGTGKTPAVVCIVKALLERGKKPGILIRGYGNDEQELLSRMAPGVVVAVGKDRVRQGRDIIARHSVRTILLDDGFQYRRLKRDLDIVCIDATDPFGNGLVIPCGSMREGLSGLKRADIFLVTKTDLAQNEGKIQGLEDRLKRINPKALIVKSVHRARHFYRLSDGRVVDTEGLKNKDLLLVSAIGSPYSFEKTVLNLGLKVKRHFIFRDHHWYKKKDLRKIEDYCVKHKIDTIVTTEKDAIKLREAKAERTTEILVLAIKFEIIDNEQGFYNRLFGIYNS